MCKGSRNLAKQSAAERLLKASVFLVGSAAVQLRKLGTKRKESKSNNTIITSTQDTTVATKAGSRVLLVVPSVTDCNGAGGVATRWNGYSKELEAAGWTVELCTVDGSEELSVPRFIHPCYPDTLSDRPTAEWTSKMWKRLRVHPSQPPVNAVIMTDMIINFPLALICRAAGVPLIYSMHTDIGKLLYGHGGLWLLRMLTELFLVRVSEASQALTAGICTAAITTSPSFMELLQSRGVRACTRFYAAIPAEEIINTYRRLQPAQIQDMREQMTAGHPERRLLCYAGRWSVEKRMHLLKECVTQLPGNITLCFIGDGPIASIVQEWADEPRVVVLQGMRPRADLALVYAAADWIVSASDFETFGNVAFEAALCGTPCLLERAQGFVDQIGKDEATGALLEYCADDSVEQLSNAMKRTAWLTTKPAQVQKAARLRQSGNGGTTVVKLLDEVAITKPAQCSIFWPLLFVTSLLISAFLSAVLSVTKLLAKTESSRKNKQRVETRDPKNE
ncbi:hypothetical protein CYMTET_22829 [Cymbomonas tetramitiformis]|uniref:Glycosyltransferase n=1 Tax=Cymbomonas tetramitiformis TaxID=36881 RepID=A0AAE0FZI0_9CHLO|nr:hypothetical protein CYMTET_22829 [Cymbomonas tetramitiformis]